MQLRPALNSAIERLTSQCVPSPRMNAELLLMFTLDCDRAHLYGHPERELTADEVRRYDEALARRTTGEPAQYITGHQEFWGMDLIVTPAVLIPRPETEHVVETVLELMPLWRGRPGPRKACVFVLLCGAGRYLFRGSLGSRLVPPPRTFALLAFNCNRTTPGAG